MNYVLEEYAEGRRSVQKGANKIFLQRLKTSDGEYVGYHSKSKVFSRRNFQGVGILVSPDQTAYAGDWVDGKKHGLGKQVFPSGEYYIGNWVNDQATGKGRILAPDGYTYEGDWVNFNKQGYGKETWSDGSYFEGNFNLN